MPKDMPKMPDGLEDLLRGLSKAVLKEKPQNILDFSAKYFENLLIARDGSLMKNYERFEHYEKTLNKMMKQKKIGGDSAKKIVKSGGKNKKTSTNPKVVKATVQNTKPNDKVPQKIEKVPSPIFGDKVIEKEGPRKMMETMQPRGKIKIRTRSSISLNAITEESNSEMKEERRLMYRNAVKKIQRAFRQYMVTKKQNAGVSLKFDDSPKFENMDEDKAARIIQNLFKSKFRKKTQPQTRPQSIKNKNLERVAEGGDDSKSLLEFMEEEENAKKSKPNIEHDSDTGETLITRVEGMNISKADSLENMIVNEDMNRQQNSKNQNLTEKVPDATDNKDQEQAAIKIQSTFRGHQVRKEIKQQRSNLENVTPVPATMIQDAVVYKNDGDMELAAVKIQKNYRGYKVRKDILSTKNLVNSGNLVAAAGNIIGSVVNQLTPSDLHSNSGVISKATELHSDKESGSINSEGAPTNEEILSEVNEIHGTVTETPEFLKNENISADILNLADSGNAKTDDNGLKDSLPGVHPVIDIDESESTNTSEISSPVPEVSQNTTQHIEPIIGINEQERKTDDIPSSDITNINLEHKSQSVANNNNAEAGIPVTEVSESNQEFNSNISEKGIVGSSKIPADLLSSESTLKHAVGNDMQGIKPLIDGATNQNIDSVISLHESKQDLGSITTKAPLIEGSPLNDVIIDSENAIHDVESHISTVDPKHEIESLTSNATQNNSILDETANSAEIPVENQNTHHDGTVQPKQEIDLLADGANSSVLDSPPNSAEIAIDSPVENQKIKNVDTVEPRHESLATEATNFHHNPVLDDPLDSAKIRTDSPVENQNSPNDGTVQPIREIESLLDGTSNVQNSSVFDGPLNSAEIGNDSPVEVQNIQDVGTVEPKQEHKSLATDATDTQHNPVHGDPLNSAENRSDSPVANQGVGTVEPTTFTTDPLIENQEIQNVDTVQPIHKIQPLATDETDTKQNPVLNEMRTDSPVENQNVQNAGIVEPKHEPESVATILQNTPVLGAPDISESRTGSSVEIHNKPNIERSSTVELKHETESINTDATSLQSIPFPDNPRNREISTDTPIEIQNVHEDSHDTEQHLFRAQDSLPDLNDPEMADAALKIQNSFRSHQARKETQQKQPTQVHIIPEVTVDGASEEMLSDSEVLNDNQHSSMPNGISEKDNQENLLDLNNSMMNDAAVKIQKTYRGHQVRKGLKEKTDHLGKLVESTVESVIPAENQFSESILPSPQTETKAEQVNEMNSQSNTLSSNDKQSIEAHEDHEKSGMLPDHHTAALKIQKTYRGHQVRKELKQIKAEIFNPATIVGSNAIAAENLNPANLIEPQDSPQNEIEQPNLEKHDSFPDLNDPEIVEAALKIQKAFIGRNLIRKDFNENTQIKNQMIDNSTNHTKPSENDKIQNTKVAIDVAPTLFENKDTLLSPTDTKLENIADSSENTSAEPISQTEAILPADDAKQPASDSKEVATSMANLIDPEKVDAAIKIQKSYRNHMVRKEYNQRKEESQQKQKSDLADAIAQSINKEISIERSATPVDVLNSESESIVSTVGPIVADDTLQHETISCQSPDRLTNGIVPPEHQDSLPDLNDPEMADAALKIQKSFRGHQARKEVTNVRKKRSLDFKEEEPFDKLMEANSPTNEEIDAAKTESDIQNLKDFMMTDNDLTSKENDEKPLEHQDSLPDLNDPEMADAAVKIQKTFRGHQVRKGSKQQSNDQLKSSVEEITEVTDNLGNKNQVTLTSPAGITTENPAEMISVPMEHQESFPDLNDPEMTDAALKIQTSFREHQARKDQKKPENQAILSVGPVADKVIDIQDTSTGKTQHEMLSVNSAINNLSDLSITGINDTETLLEPVADNEQLVDPSNNPVGRQDSLPDLNDPEMSNAALKIQKSFRGHQARKEIKQKETTETVGPAPDSMNGVGIAAETIKNGELSSNQDSLSKVPDQMVEENPDNFAMEYQDTLLDLNDPEMTDAALKIQKSFRGHQARKEIKQKEIDKSTETVDPAPDSMNGVGIAAETIKNGELSSNQDSLSEVPDQMVEENPDNSAMEHQDSLPNLNDPEMADAALKIQKSFRGYQTRKESNERKNDQLKTVSEPMSDLNRDLGDSMTTQISNDTEIKPQVEYQDSLPDLNDPEMADAALKIQKSFRGHKARKGFKEIQENITIDKILSEASAPPTDEIGVNGPLVQLTEHVQDIKDDNLNETALKFIPTAESNILSNIAPDIIAKTAETAAINIQRTYRGYRTRRDLKSQNTPHLAGDVFEDENKLVDSLEPILDQKSDDKIDADSLDNFNVEDKTEVIEEPCQKIVYKSKLSMLIENSKSDTQSSSSDKVDTKPTNDDYFDSLENTQTSEMDESAKTVIEVQLPSMVDTSHEEQNTYDSSIFGLQIEPEHEQREADDDSISRKTTAEVEVPDTKIETRGGMTDDEIKEIQNIDLASFDKDSLEAMYYSLRKNELRLDQMHSLSNVDQISDETEPPRRFTAKQKLMSMGESDSDDIVFKHLSIDNDEYSEISNQHTARSTTDDDADVEVVRDVLYYNDGKQVLPEVRREPGDGASVASDNLFDSHSNADDQDVLAKPSAHHFEIFSLDEEINNLESNVAPYQQDNPLFYAQQKIEKFLHQIHGNINETEDDADDENDEEFLENPIDSNKSYLSENNFNAEDEEEDDVVDELRNDFRESSARKVLSSAVSEADSDYIEQGRAKPIKDDFNISTALDNYLSSDSDSTYNSAATKIQAGARGFLTRRRIQSINRQSISERRSSIGNAAIDQSLDDMIEENEERKKLKFHEAESTFREDTITSSCEMEMYGITDIKVEEKKIASPVTDSGNESNTSIDAETHSHLRNNYEQFENESSFDAIAEDNLNHVADVIRTSNVQNKVHSPIKNKTLSNINFNEYDRAATRRMTLQRGNAVQGNSTPSDEENRSQPSGSSSTATTNSEEKSDQQDDVKKISYDSPIRRKSTDSASLKTKSSNSLPDMHNTPKKRGFIQRQRTMPVQIETEIIRPLPKHMRKRIQSANSSAHSSYHASKKKSTY